MTRPRNWSGPRRRSPGPAKIEAEACRTRKPRWLLPRCVCRGLSRSPSARCQDAGHENWEEKAFTRHCSHFPRRTRPRCSRISPIAGRGRHARGRGDRPDGQARAATARCAGTSPRATGRCSGSAARSAITRGSPPPAKAGRVSRWMCSMPGAFKRYWDAVVEPLIADAGPLAGQSLKYLHTDSWEVEAINWTPTLREEFQQTPRLRFPALAAGAAGSDRGQPPSEQPFPARFPQDPGRPGDRQPLPHLSRPRPPARPADPSRSPAGRTRCRSTRSAAWA